MPIRSKAYVTTLKPKYLQKVIQHSETIHDAYNDNFKSKITLFIPKIRRMYPQPVVMCHISNGSSSAMIRVSNPEELALVFEKLGLILRTDLWLDTYRRLTDCYTMICTENQATLGILDKSIFDDS